MLYSNSRLGWQSCEEYVCMILNKFLNISKTYCLATKNTMSVSLSSYILNLEAYILNLDEVCSLICERAVNDRKIERSTRRLCQIMCRTMVFRPNFFKALFLAPKMFKWSGT